MNFFIPGLSELFPLNMALLDMRDAHPHWFYDDVKIDAVFGAFPNTLWNGGRTFMGRMYLGFDVKRIIKAYNTRGLSCRFTFTNLLIEDKHLTDTYCNLLCEMAQNGMNDIIIASDVLEEYIRKTYPDYKLISSITKCLSKEETLAELEKDYKFVVLNANFNADKEFLQSLPHKDKVEILANCSCVSGCTRKKDHYIDASQAQIDCFSTDASKEKEFCTRYASNFFEAKSRRDWLTYEDLRERVDMGFNNFKIEGRDALFNPSMVFTLIETYTHYFIKPEFKDMFRYELACRAVDAGVFEHCGNW